MVYKSEDIGAMGIILVSPWLIKDRENIQYVIKANEKPLHMLQKG